MMLQLIDKELVRERFSRTLDRYDGAAAAQERTARTLVEEILRFGDSFETVFEAGCGSGLLTREIASRLKMKNYVANDIVEECRPCVEEALRNAPAAQLRFLAGDLECLHLPGRTFDLIVSNAVFHWLEDFASLVPRLADSMRPGGLFAFSTFGPENLYEIRTLTGRGLHYLSSEETEALLSDRFTILRRREEKHTLRFSSPREVLRHIRLTGVNGLVREGWTKGSLRSFEERYVDLFGGNDDLPLTYHSTMFLAELSG